MTNLLDEVLDLNSSTSDKYVVEPDRRQIQGDLLVGLRRFKNTLRWKEYWRIQKNSRRKVSKDNEGETSDESESEEETQEEFVVKLKPKHKVTQAPKGTEALEGFLKTLENELLSVLFDETKVINQTEKN